MAYGRTKMGLNCTLPVGCPRPPAEIDEDDAPGTDAAQRRELQSLRSINARLLRELAVLREREAQAQQLADRDALTGLYNRRRLSELLEAAIREASRLSQCVGLLFIDLNGFKQINDEYGHAAGDAILTMVASRINARVRIDDYVCRFGGDEFVVVLPSVPDAAALRHIADGVRERVGLPYRVGYAEQHLTAAIGESLYPRDGGTAEELLQRADQAMYRLKHRLARPMFSFGPTSLESPARRRND